MRPRFIFVTYLTGDGGYSIRVYHIAIPEGKKQVMEHWNTGTQPMDLRADLVDMRGRIKKYISSGKRKMTVASRKILTIEREQTSIKSTPLIPLGIFSLKKVHNMYIFKND